MHFFFILKKIPQTSLNMKNEFCVSVKLVNWKGMCLWKCSNFLRFFAEIAELKTPFWIILIGYGFLATPSPLKFLIWSHMHTQIEHSIWMFGQCLCINKYTIHGTMGYAIKTSILISRRKLCLLLLSLSLKRIDLKLRSIFDPASYNGIHGTYITYDWWLKVNKKLIERKAFAKLKRTHKYLGVKPTHSTHAQVDVIHIGFWSCHFAFR